GEAVLGTVLAQRLGLGVGDEVMLETSQGPRSVRVAAIATEYTVGGMALYLEWESARRLLGVPGVHAFEGTARRGADAEQSPRRFCGEHRLMLQSNAELRAVIDRKVGGVQGFLYVLLALVFVVASLGIVNTLTMNVQEQTRELGVLRALGMKRRQVRKMILAQALALGVISLLPATGAGLGLAYLMNLATQPLLGQRVAFRLDPLFVGGCIGLALVSAGRAALRPARRAARLRVITALQYE